MTEENKTIMRIIDQFDNLPAVKCRTLFDKLESELKKLPQLTDEDYQLKEYYSGGLYCRQITIPAGALITGRIYKFDHIEMMVSGEITIISADGPKNTYEGFNVISAKSGKRQAGLAISDTVWMTVNQVPENVPLNKMLDYTSVLTYEEYDSFYKELNNLDYNKFLSQLGINQEQMDEMVTANDVVDMPLGYEYIYKKESKLSGIGLFTKKQINKGEIICPARIGKKRTIAGRYSNHAFYANSVPFYEKDMFYFVANSDIRENEEITINYRDVLNFRERSGDLL